MSTAQIAKTIKKRVSRAAINGNGLMKIVKGEIKRVRKRNGQTATFDIEKIVNATYKAMLAVGEGGEKEAIKIAEKVYLELLKMNANGEGVIPEVEQIQDLVEKHLIFADFAQTTKAYILFRQRRAEAREKELSVPENLRREIRKNSKFFENRLAELIYYRTYSRWLDDKGRRETWEETVKRFIGFMRENLGGKLTDREYNQVRKAILNQEIVPSMRLLWSADKAARVTNVAAYNCSFIAPTKFQDFGEIMYILMCGAGLGFSVESQTAQQLPQIKKQTGKKVRKHIVADSKEGWADAFALALKAWFNGGDIEFDYSKVRPEGTRLKTMGGRASGPQPLMDLMEFTQNKILKKQGRRLSNLDVHDIVCKIGEIVVAGGVRRSALISLSDLEDEEMRHAKDGQFYVKEGQRSMANNSAVYEGKPSAAEFLREWEALASSGSGERGIFNRDGFKNQLPTRRWKKFEKYFETSGINPCGEIILRSKQFCNLAGIVVRSDDTEKTLLRKIRLATLLGTYQATLIDFPYLSKEWKKNCKEEALLGVSITGYFDNKVVRKPGVLRKMKKESIKVNKKYAKKFKINSSTCITCVKPSGNSSQLLDTASGMHPRYAKYYIRRVRISSTDPLFKMLKDQGVPCFPEIGQAPDSVTTYVLEFPVKSPKGAIFKDDLSALEFLEHWKNLKENFTEHNPSATIYVGDDEWVEVGNWVYQNWDIVGGLSFLPRNNHIYKLAPYEEIDEKTYRELSKKITNIDFSKLPLYESQDNTQGAKEYACVAGGCEV
jgi:ribonucleoside-diphosphate reductase alpha chain